MLCTCLHAIAIAAFTLSPSLSCHCRDVHTHTLTLTHSKHPRIPAADAGIRLTRIQLGGLSLLHKRLRHPRAKHGPCQATEAGRQEQHRFANE